MRQYVLNFCAKTYFGKLDVNSNLDNSTVKLIENDEIYNESKIAKILNEYFVNIVINL